MWQKAANCPSYHVSMKLLQDRVSRNPRRNLRETSQEAPQNPLIPTRRTGPPSQPYNSSLSALCAWVSARFPILSSLTCFRKCRLAMACAFSQNTRAARPSSVSRMYHASTEKETSRPPVARSGRESGLAQAITASSWRLGVYFERSLSLSAKC